MSGICLNVSTVCEDRCQGCVLIFRVCEDQCQECVLMCRQFVRPDIRDAS